MASSKSTACACGGKPASIFDVHPEKKQQLEDFLSSLDLSGDMDTRRGHLILGLHKAQHIFGYLPLEVQQLVASRLRLQQADVYGVISFYSYFTDKPVGRNKVCVCLGTACFVRGAEKILQAFKERLKIEENASTPDMNITLTSLRCVGACSLAPVVMVNDRVYGNVTTKMVPKIIADCK